MITQKCPKCNSGRIRRGYRPTSVFSKLIFRYNLLCDTCNWEFTGFAIPIKTDYGSDVKKQEKPVTHTWKSVESDPEISTSVTTVSGSTPRDSGAGDDREVEIGDSIDGKTDSRSGRSAAAGTGVRNRSGGVAKKTAVQSKSSPHGQKSGPKAKVRDKLNKPRSPSLEAATVGARTGSRAKNSVGNVVENGDSPKSVSKRPNKKRSKQSVSKSGRKKTA